MPKGTANSGLYQLNTRRADHSGEMSREKISSEGLSPQLEKSVLAENIGQKLTELQRVMEEGVVSKPASHIRKF